MLDRPSLIANVTGEYQAILELADFTADDTTGNMKEPTDWTFRYLGVLEASLDTASVADGKETQAMAYLTYFLLAKATAALAANMSVGGGRARAELQQQFDHVKALRDEALYVAQSYGLTVVATSTGISPIPFAGGMDAADFETDDSLPKLFSIATAPGIPFFSDDAVGELA